MMQEGCHAGAHRLLVLYSSCMWEKAYVRNLKSCASNCWGHLVIRALRGSCKGSNQVYSTIPVIIIFPLHFLSLTRPNPFLVLFIYFIMFPYGNFPTPLISHQFLCALPSSIIFPVHNILLMWHVWHVTSVCLIYLWSSNYTALHWLLIDYINPCFRNHLSNITWYSTITIFSLILWSVLTPAFGE